MKIHLRPSEPVLSRSLTRVADALERTAPPEVTLVARPGGADLVVYHVLGRGQQALIERDQRAGKPYAMIQYCLASSDVPQILDWVPAWERAVGVWSYYNLHALIGRAVGDDPMQAGTRAMWSRINVYHTPLGVDRTIFNTTGGRYGDGRPYLLMTTGYVAETESLRECAAAVQVCGGRMLHLGKDLALGPHVDVVTDLTDAQVAECYRSTRFVAGLRRIEGFELPVLEGFACGATPIVFDTPCYDWFARFAWRVPEWPPADLTAQLVPILRRGLPKMHSDEDPDQLLAPFDWDTITRGFWERLLA